MNISDLVEIAADFNESNIDTANSHLGKYGMALVTDHTKPMGPGVTNAVAFNWAQEVLNLSTPLLHELSTELEATHIKPSRLIVRPT